MIDFRELHGIISVCWAIVREGKKGNQLLFKTNIVKKHYLVYINQLCPYPGVTYVKAQKEEQEFLNHSFTSYDVFPVRIKEFIRSLWAEIFIVNSFGGFNKAIRYFHCHCDEAPDRKHGGWRHWFCLTVWGCRSLLMQRPWQWVALWWGSVQPLLSHISVLWEGEKGEFLCPTAFLSPPFSFSLEPQLMR